MNKLVLCLDNYLARQEELVVYNVIKCFVELGKLRLLNKDDMISLFGRFCPLIFFPNEWIRSITIEYCKMVYSYLTDAEVFLRIRPLLQNYVKNFILMTNSDPFYEFLSPPLTRTLTDICEANLGVQLHCTNEDEEGRARPKIESMMQDMQLPDSSDQRKKNYLQYISTLEEIHNLRPEVVEKKSGSIVRIPSGNNVEGNNAAQHIENKRKIFEIENFDVKESEVDDYIEQNYYPQLIPSDPNFLSNNERNPEIYFKNYLDEEGITNGWNQAYKQRTLCKSLHFYSQHYNVDLLKDKQGKFYSYSVTHQWKQWRPQGRLIYTLHSHKAEVLAIGVSDDSNLMATGSADGKCCVWDMQNIERKLALKPLENIRIPSKITAIKFLENTHSLAICNNQGSIGVYKIEPQTAFGHVQPLKTISTPNEGEIVGCCTYLTSEGQNVLVYATQLGGIHVHDMRVKKNINHFDMGCQRGIISCFSMGKDENNYLIGTQSGFIGIYDIRFNLISSMWKYTRGSPVSDLCAYLPEKYSKATGGISITNPMFFVASGCETPQVDLCSLDKEQAVLTLAVGNPLCPYKSYTPYGLLKQDIGFAGMNNVMTSTRRIDSMMRKDEQIGELAYINSRDTFQESYKKIRTRYDLNSGIYKILCPRISRSEESAPFLLSTGADRIVRYWHLGPEAADASFQVICPDERECEYIVKEFTDKVIYEHTKKPVEPVVPQKMHSKEVQDKKPIRSPFLGHTDAILNLGLLDLPFGAFMVTCGRDNLVKIWT